jgi:hypothetical protein
MYSYTCSRISETNTDRRKILTTRFVCFRKESSGVLLKLLFYGSETGRLVKPQTCAFARMRGKFNTWESPH